MNMNIKYIFSAIYSEINILFDWIHFSESILRKEHGFYSLFHK